MEHNVDIEKLNYFIGIPETQITNEKVIAEKCCYQVMYSKTPSAYFTESVIETIRKYYFSTEKPEIEEIDIAIHIRRGDVSKNGTHKNRFIDNSVYIKAINNLKKMYPDYKIHIYSQGKLEDFADLVSDNVFFHLNEEISKTFHSFVMAKVLVTCISSLSYCAAILNSNTIFYYNFFHYPLDKWLNFVSLLE